MALAASVKLSARPAATNTTTERSEGKRDIIGYGNPAGRPATARPRTKKRDISTRLQIEDSLVWSAASRPGKAILSFYFNDL
jgi:hypothetical protein